jgi:hypothetical protein
MNLNGRSEGSMSAVDKGQRQALSDPVPVSTRRDMAHPALSDPDRLKPRCVGIRRGYVKRDQYRRRRFRRPVA